MSIFEIIMLLCFGAAWPFSIKKSFTLKKNGSKSITFLIVVFIGYIAGIIHKMLYSMDLVIWLYSINGCMVFIDILIYFRNKKLETT